LINGELLPYFNLRQPHDHSILGFPRFYILGFPLNRDNLSLLIKKNKQILNITQIMCLSYKKYLFWLGFRSGILVPFLIHI